MMRPPLIEPDAPVLVDPFLTDAGPGIAEHTPGHACVAQLVGQDAQRFGASSDPYTTRSNAGCEMTCLDDVEVVASDQRIDSKQSTQRPYLAAAQERPSHT